MNIPLAHFIYLFICLYYMYIYRLPRTYTRSLGVRLDNKDSFENAFVISITLSNVRCATTVEIWMYKRYNHLYIIKVFSKCITCKYRQIWGRHQSWPTFCGHLSAQYQQQKSVFLNNFNSSFWNSGIRCVFYNNMSSNSQFL